MSIPASFLTEWFETVRIILNAPQRNPPRKSCLAHLWEYIRYGDRSHEYYWAKRDKLDCINMLCYNPMLTWKIIQENSDIEWNYSVLSMHPCITPAIVKEHPDIPWDPLRLGANPSFTYEDVKHLHAINKPLEVPKNCWDNISFEPNELDSLFCTSPKMMPLHVFRRMRHLHTSLRHVAVLSFLRNPLTSAVAEVVAEERKRLRSKCLVELTAIPWLPVDLIRKTVEFL